MEEIINQFSYFLPIFFLFIGLLVLFLLPRIRWISLKTGYFDNPDNRSSHDDIVPTFGGVAFFIALIFTFFAHQTLDTDNVILTMMASLTVMFFTGLKDDFRAITPGAKFLGQIIALGLLMIHPEFRITNLFGFLGIHEVPLFVSVSGSLFLILGLVNAFNLIDGIDGMASITGIVISICYSIVFYKLGLAIYLGISVAMVAMLLAFLRYNFSSKKKIFMGDTGSLIIGLILGILTMRLLSIGDETMTAIGITRNEIPLLILGSIAIPTLDISRVIFIRMTNKLPVFSADRNHIHHVLVDNGLTHFQASFTVGLINSMMILVTFFSIKWFGLITASIILIIMVVLFIYSIFIVDKKPSTIRLKVHIRNLLFSTTSFFRKPDEEQKEHLNIRKVRFNKMLKKAGIFFF